MPKYTVHFREIVRAHVVVEAVSEEAAEKMVKDCEYDMKNVMEDDRDDTFVEAVEEVKGS